MYGDYEGNADRREHLIGARNRDPQCQGANCELEVIGTMAARPNGRDL